MEDIGTKICFTIIFGFNWLLVFDLFFRYSNVSNMIQIAAAFAIAGVIEFLVKKHKDFFRFWLPGILLIVAWIF